MPENQHKKCCLCGTSTNSSVSYFGFPQAQREARKWKAALGLSNTAISKSSKVCSLHFSAKDILARTGAAKRSLLCPGAVPRSLSHPPAPASDAAAGPSTPHTRAARTPRRSVAPSPGADQRNDNAPTPVRCRLLKGDLHKSHERLKRIQAEKRESNALLRKERQQYERDRGRWTSKELPLTQQLRKSQEEVAALRTSLHTVFTEGQVKRLQTSEMSHWSEADIVQALSLRSVSSKAYTYVRQKMKIPLPGVTTLRSWTKGFTVTPGVIQVSLRTMQAIRETLTPMERNVILSFDEMHVDASLQYDRADDRVYGQFSTVQVAPVRSLAAKWKQPVYFDFAQNMTRDILFHIIEREEEVGLSAKLSPQFFHVR